MKKKHEFDKSLLILFAIILITTITALFLYLNVRVDRISQIIKDHGVLKVLITVVEDEKPLITQVLLINTDTNKGALIDIPGNTGSIIESQQRFSRVDSIYSDQGIDAYRSKIGNILSIDIPFHINLDVADFSQTIDFLDGLDLFVSKSIETISDSFYIPSGSVVLEGDKVLQYLNLNIEGEHKTAKVSRRHKIIQSYLAQLKIYSDKITKENILLEMSSRLTTNLDLAALEKLFDLFGILEVDRLVFQGVLGENKIVSDDELIFPYNKENLIKVIVKRILINLSNPEVISDEKLNFNIQVLNGTSIPGLASRASIYLSSFGYTMSDPGNASKGSDEYEYTSILIRKGNKEAAESIGELINCDDIYSNIEEGIDDTIDFTIILGKDFDGKRCKD